MVTPSSLLSSASQQLGMLGIKTLTACLDMNVVIKFYSLYGRIWILCNNITFKAIVYMYLE